MAKQQRPFRRVVTGNDADGYSGVLWDSNAANTRPNPVVPGTGMTQFWCFETMPASVAGEDDLGAPPFTDAPPQNGLFLRYVESAKMPDGYDLIDDPTATPEHEPIFEPITGRGDRGGRNKGQSGIHMTRSVDYGFLMEGKRTLILDDGASYDLKKGDVVIELGNYHAWSNPYSNSVMGYVMIGGTYDEEGE